MQRRHVLQTLPLMLLPGLAWSQDYPKPGAALRYVVPFPPGGLTDVMARLVGQKLGERWKISVVVDNKPGSGGQIGAADVAKAAGDGQTILAITMTHAANATLFKGKANFDFVKDLRPVALLAGSPMLVVVPAASPVKDFKDLVARAKTAKLNAGSSGNGTPPHLTLALFNDLYKTDVQHVPYKGGAPSMTDLIGGQLDVIFSNFPESVAHVKSGKLRALAIASSARHPALPDVPTTAEAGAPQLAVENWTAIMAPAGTPDAAVEALGAEVVRIMAAPEIEERARTQGFRVDARGPQAFGRFLGDEVQRWATIIAAAKISVE
ncbi:MAG: ABC transporter substrate-binding protein [Leptothrix sp. (in: Bacteria)]|nr:ABC transporter substrate-binding protein [Leptothrix sp. (in: b-proteobacteria)]